MAVPFESKPMQISALYVPVLGFVASTTQSKSHTMKPKMRAEPGMMGDGDER